MHKANSHRILIVQHCTVTVRVIDSAWSGPCGACLASMREIVVEF